METLKMLVDIATLLVLGIMSITVIAYAFERLSFYRKVDIKKFDTKNKRKPH